MDATCVPEHDTGVVGIVVGHLEELVGRTVWRAEGHTAELDKVARPGVLTVLESSELSSATKKRSWEGLAEKEEGEVLQAKTTVSYRLRDSHSKLITDRRCSEVITMSWAPVVFTAAVLLDRFGECTQSTWQARSLMIDARFVALDGR